MTIGGYIITGKRGSPWHGFGGTIIVYDSVGRAAGVAGGFDNVATAAGIGPLAVSPVELRILNHRGTEKAEGKT